jgi:RND family efflux transporter MFP subunit
MITAPTNVSFAAQGMAGVADATTADRHSARDAALRDLHDRLNRTEQAAQVSGAALDLLDKLARAGGLRHACQTLVSELQEFFACQRAAFGLRRPNRRNCRLAAISGLAQFDARSDFVRAVESAMNECVLRGATTIWPAGSDADRHALLAHQRLASLSGSDRITTVPLRGAAGEIVGTILLFDTAPEDYPSDVQPLLKVCERQLGQWIELVRRAEAGPIAGRFGAARRFLRVRAGKAALAVAALLAAALTLPLPYKIKCDCQVQPVTRRFVAAPFEGRLEKSFVKQGDVVRQGQELARMDGREIRWELAGLVAEHNRASKQRDAAMAAGKVADAQAAKLDMERCHLKIQLLEHRTENLEVRSPIDGIVIGGDLERAEGAPLTIGQTLFEVAPLEEMLVEVAIPEDEISSVAEGLDVSVRLDAYPGRDWHATLSKIHPRAEIRQSQNVFVAELQLQNNDRSLRPGMSGRARIVGPRRSLAWNLFHKPADWLARTLAW